MSRMTIKDVENLYKGKMYGDRFPERITKIVHSHFSDGRKISILCSGKYMRDESCYHIEAVIDRASGKNLIEGRCRPAEDTTDIIDVAWEMLYEEDL